MLLTPELLIGALVTGLGLGSMYGLLALGFYITYSVSSTVNFSQGSSMMLGAVLAYSLVVSWHWPGPLGIAAALALCAIYGLAVERFAVRPFARRGSNAWLMATVAVGIIADNAVLFTFGKEPRRFPSALTQMPVDVFGTGVYPLQLIIPVVGLALAAALHVIARRTTYGKALLAVVQNPDAARLMGIDVKRAIAASFAISTVFAGVAGVLIAPLFNIQATMGTLFGIKAFAVAILGGIMSPWGVMVAGLLFGVTEALITTVFGSVYTQIAMFALVILALALRPDGLFGRAGVKKV